FGREMTTQLLARGDRVVGTVRNTKKIEDLISQYPKIFYPEILDVTDITGLRGLVERSFKQLGRIDVVVSNAGYGLFGAAEELSDQEINHMMATNLIGSIQLIRAVIPHLREQGGG